MGIIHQKLKPICKEPLALSAFTVLFNLFLLSLVGLVNKTTSIKISSNVMQKK